MSERKTIIRTVGLKKHYTVGGNTVRALDGVDMSVLQGEFVCVAGRSGSGKSTMLNMLAGLEPPTEGEIIVRGKHHLEAMDEELRTKFRRRYIGFVFQNYNLFPHYTVMKNITDAPVRVLKRPREQAEARARELIAQMGLTGNENKVPCELSGGQQQRVSIARALALDPEILFFDEPTSALDPELTAEVLRVIKDLAAQNMTMVIVTHAMQFARDVADRVVFMDGGRIVEEGPAEQVIDHPREQRTREFLSRIEG